MPLMDFRDMARDPQFRRKFERLLDLACQRGDADLVAERLSWGIDPNCTFAKGRTPLMSNIRKACPSAATVEALLKAGADPELIDEAGLTALDYARRKLAKLQGKRRKVRKSTSLDENRHVLEGALASGPAEVQRPRRGGTDRGAAGGGG
jgi:hypothetical protein